MLVSNCVLDRVMQRGELLVNSNKTCAEKIRLKKLVIDSMVLRIINCGFPERWERLARGYE